MEEYISKFLDLGVKKVKNIDIVEKHQLVVMGVKELEILRLMKKKSMAFGPKIDAANTSQSSSTYIRVPMPSNSFGHTVGTFSQDHLKKMYNELWYNTPQNIKQHENNTFILQMCSAAAWRFPNKNS